jgi:outer membrane protein TolC
LEKLAVEQRPELRALESSINKSERAVELAERNRKYPDFMVGLQYWFAPDQSTKHMYAPMVTLSIPFSPWTKGKHDYEVEEALAERQAARANLIAVKNMTLFEVTEISAKVEAAMKSVSRWVTAASGAVISSGSFRVSNGRREFHDAFGCAENY